MIRYSSMLDKRTNNRADKISFLKSLFLISVVSLELVSCASSEKEPVMPVDVINTYIKVAQASYEDSLITAKDLETAIHSFLDNPNQHTLDSAKDAWRSARVPYQQTEAFRFGNAIVDDWEGRVNAWPLDEGLIDYTAASYGDESDNNYFYTANIIANPQIRIAGIEVDASDITAELLASTLHEIDGVDANVATGYHAIEFLLWGQDLHGTNLGAGERPYTDYSLQNCTGGHCERRREFLKVLASLLVSDLEEMAESWQPGNDAYMDLRNKGLAGGLATILTGMGSLSYGELAGERIRLGLLLHDPEEEHDCFSDNTHISHYYDGKGIENVYYGRYRRINGELVSGAGINDLLKAVDAELSLIMEQHLAETDASLQALVDAAEAGQPFDVLIASGNEDGEVIITRIVDALIAQTHVIEDIISTLELDNISIEGSDSLDNPASVL